MSDDSYIGVRDGECRSFVGPDATNYVRAVTVAQGLRMYAKHGMRITRMATPTRLLQAATQYTGKRYKRGAYLQAADDVMRWADEMKAALPKVED